MLLLFPYISANPPPDSSVRLNQIDVSFCIDTIDSEAVTSDPAFILPHRSRAGDIWRGIDKIRSEIDWLAANRQNDAQFLDADKQILLPNN